MPVDWSLAGKNQYDYLDSLQQLGNAQFQQQRLQQGNYAFANAQKQDAARPQILAAARNGDYRGAQDQAFGVGDMDALKFVGSLQDDQRAQLRQHVDAIGGVAANLYGLPLDQRKAALLAAAPSLKNLGFTDEEIAGADVTDAGLMGYIGAARSSKDAIDAWEKSQAPLTVADGAQVFGATPAGGGARPLIADNPKDPPKPDYVYDSERGVFIQKPGTGGLPAMGTVMPSGVPGGGGQPSSGPVTVETLKPLFSAQESGGSYTARNPETGAMGRWQVMPGTGAALAKRLGLEWRPDMMLHDTPADRAYQDKIGEAAMAEAVAKANGDPTTAFGYYYSGTTNRAKWGPKTKQYIADMGARLSGRDPRAPQATPEGGGSPLVIPTGLPPKNKDYRILTPEEAAQRGLDASSRWQIGPNNQITALPSKGDKPLTEAQGKATGYLERAVAAAETLNSIPKAPTPNEANAALYGMDTRNPFRRNISPEAQRALSAQEAFVLAVLRQDSGAAINKDEVSSAMRIYFPQPGDSAETQADKRRQREAAIRGLRTAAGPGADTVRGKVPPGSGARVAPKVLKIERVR